MKNISSIKKMAILSLFFLMVALILIFLFALPLFNEIEKYSQNITNKNSELSFFEKDAIQSKEFEKDRASLNLDINKIDNSFAKVQAPIDLIKFWEETARACKLFIEISPTSQKSLPSVKEIGFNLQIQGIFPDILRFIEKIENGPYLIQIQNYSSTLGQSGVNTEIKVIVFAK
jgi:hypothetical protein